MIVCVDGAARRPRTSPNYSYWASTARARGHAIEHSRQEGSKRRHRLLKRHLGRTGPGGDFSYGVGGFATSACAERGTAHIRRRARALVVTGAHEAPDHVFTAGNAVLR